jgi:hypothetical protein
MFNSEKLSSITFSRKATYTLLPSFCRIIRDISSDDFELIKILLINKHDVFPHSTIGLQLIHDFKEE